MKKTPEFNFPTLRVYKYGSHVYGTNHEFSDDDYIVVTPDFFRCSSFSVPEDTHVIPKTIFINKLFNHDIDALECYFQDEFQMFPFELDLKKLRHSISSTASNSYVKAKKKLIKERDYYIGKKSLWHSLRILNFGIQIAEAGRIYDYGAMNFLYNEIVNNESNDWDYFDKRYKVIYNKLKSKFKKVAPK